MVVKSEIKIQKSGSRHTIYLKKDLVNDSSFPFKPNQLLTIRIKDEQLIIEKKEAV